MKALLLFFAVTAPALAAPLPPPGVSVEVGVFSEPAGSNAFSEPLGHDRAEDVVDELAYRSLSAMESAGLKKVAITQPWSDSYWPLYGGGIARRYADPDFELSLEWEKNERYLSGNVGIGATEELSPAEKYDLLVGDKNFTLTRASLGLGRAYFEKHGRVAPWMGICHGWAAASVSTARPSHSVILTGVGGEKILFYPSDIKALLSMLWAKGKFEKRFIGGRCRKSKPGENPPGRPVDPECLDTNAGTWHLAVVNQLGHSRRPLIIDATYDAEVWNQPVYSYEYSYLDPGSLAPVDSLAKSLRAVDDKDPRRAFRAPTAVSVATVAMRIEYSTEQDPEAVAEDDRSRDGSSAVSYEYELELDANGEIVGGEWLQVFHPDFIWTPVKGAKARSAADEALGGDTSVWSFGNAPPAGWAMHAPLASAKSQPIARIVERMVEFAN